MSRSRARAISFVVVTILAGGPAVAAACELACSHEGETIHHSAESRPDHSHHGTTKHSGSHEMGGAMTACHRDCCRDGAVVVTAAVSGRVDATSCDTHSSLIPADSTRFLLRPTTRTAQHRGAPPGISSPPVRPFSLRI